MTWIAKACLYLASIALPAAAMAAECNTTRYDGAPFSWCAIDLSQEELRLWLYSTDAEPFSRFSEIDEALRADGKALGLAINAGMFHQDRSAVGLYIEEGLEKHRLVTAAGPGNFGLLPNGVFCIAKSGAQVIESRQFAQSAPACTYATQSGPMLVIDGALHPRFLPDSDSLRIRNGVGVRTDGQSVIIAISDRPVNFHHFGRFFRDVLDTPNALYLDGSVSQLFAPALGRFDSGPRLGPILGTVVPSGG
ncbi:MAG: phosphodiester glycosidase family protein [Pseudomonadota bacterium]